MNSALLGKLFGQEQRWVGPCTVIMDAEAFEMAQPEPLNATSLIVSPSIATNT